MRASTKGFAIQRISEAAPHPRFLREESRETVGFFGRSVKKTCRWQVFSVGPACYAGRGKVREPGPPEAGPENKNHQSNVKNAKTTTYLTPQDLGIKSSPNCSTANLSVIPEI